MSAKGSGQQMSNDPVENQLRKEHWTEYRDCPKCGHDHISISFVLNAGSKGNYFNDYQYNKGRIYKYKCNKCYTAWHSPVFLRVEHSHF